MREHQYEFEMPHAAARIWALFQDYDRWTDYAPMVKRVDVLWPGDEQHNGRLRRVIYKMPMGREGSALELVSDVEPERGYTYTMISGTPGNDQIGHIASRRSAPTARCSISTSGTTSKRPRSNGSRARYTSSSTRTTRIQCAARRRIESSAAWRICIVSSWVYRSRRMVSIASGATSRSGISPEPDRLRVKTLNSPFSETE